MAVAWLVETDYHYYGNSEERTRVAQTTDAVEKVAVADAIRKNFGVLSVLGNLACLVPLLAGTRKQPVPAWTPKRAAGLVTKERLVSFLTADVLGRRTLRNWGAHGDDFVVRQTRTRRILSGITHGSTRTFRVVDEVTW